MVDLLVNNAGIGSYGEFRASDLERELGIIHVNCSALVHLTHLYLRGMVERRSGAILIVSSTAAYQGVPYMATYAASSQFLRQGRANPRTRVGDHTRGRSP